MKNFLNMTKVQLENISRDELNKLSEEEFLAYYEANGKVGSTYLYDGLTESEWAIKNNIDPNYIPIRFYGTFSKTLKMIENKWQIMQGAGLVPPFKERPLAVDEKKFCSLMESLGVSTDTLKEYLAFTPDYSNF